MLLTHTRRTRKRCGSGGYIRTIYTYTPYGAVTAEGDVTQPIQWSSEVYAPELALNYYKTADGCKAGWTCAKHAPGGRGAVGRLRVNYRYYNPTDGRWTRRDPIGTNRGNNLYAFSQNAVPLNFDILGLANCSQADIDRVIDNLQTAADYYIKSPEKAVGLLRGLPYRSYVPIKITKGTMHCWRTACKRGFFGRIVSSCKRYTSVSYYINLHIHFLYSDEISLEALLRYVEPFAKIPGSEALKKLEYTTVPKVNDKYVKLEGRTYERLCSGNES